MKWPDRSVSCHASSLGDLSGSASAASTPRARSRSGMRFQWRRVAGLRGSRPASPFSR